MDFLDELMEAPQEALLKESSYLFLKESLEKFFYNARDTFLEVSVWESLEILLKNM